MTIYQPNPNGVIVLGMHRSGTSCLAGMLELAGFWSGQVEKWNPDNLRGNRENVDVVNLNNSLLRLAGGSWDKPPSPPINPETRHFQTRDQIVSLMCSRPEPWMFKDPRTLLTLPFWMEALPGAQLIGVFRHPVSVANSLLVRNNISLAAGLRLWQIYNRRLLDLLSNRDFPLLLFSQDLGQFKKCAEQYVCNRFAEAVHRGLVDPVPMSQFVSQELIHQTEDPLSDLADELASLGIDAEEAQRICTIWSALLTKSLNLPEDQVDRPSSPDRNNQPATGQRLSDIQIESDTEVKFTSLEKLLRQQPLRSDLWHYGLKILEETGDHERICNWMERGLEALGADPILLAKKAQLKWLEGDKERAISIMEEIVESTRGWIPALRTLSEWHFARQEWKQAAKAFHRILDHSPPVAEDSHFIQLFVDSGSGFSEEASIKIPAKTAKMRQRFEFSLSGFKNVQKLRLDPLDDYSIVKLHDIRLLNRDDEDLAFDCTAINAKTVINDVYYFAVKDSQIGIRPAESALGGANKLIVSLEFLRTGSSALEACLAQIDQGRRLDDRKVKPDERSLTYDVSVLERIGSIRRPIVDELDFILAWNFEAHASEDASPGHQILQGWICPAGDQALNLALKYNGATRSYPMNMDRPDIRKAVAKRTENPHHVHFGFRYEVPESTVIDIGVDHEMKLYWLESLLT